jgi:hypothetical protein
MLAMMGDDYATSAIFIASITFGSFRAEKLMHPAHAAALVERWQFEVLGLQAKVGSGVLCHPRPSIPTGSRSGRRSIRVATLNQ